MKKIILTSLIAISCAFSSLFAFSWSGLVDNNTRLSANDDFSDIALRQGNGVYFSINTNVTDDGNFKFAAEGLYKYKFDYDFKSEKNDLKNIADCDLAKLSGNLVLDKGMIALNVGRFKYSDFSGSVFSQVTDGAYVYYNNQKIKASVYAGYTGFLNRLNVSMVENEYSTTDQFYALCPKYIPVIADFSYKTLFESHTIGGQVEYFLPVTDDNTQKAYGTVIMNGYIGGNVAAYDAKLTLGTEKFEGIMVDAKFDAHYFAGSKTMLTAGLEYASGEQGSIKPFITLSGRSFGSSPFYNGVIVPKLAAMYSSDKLYGSLTERVIISMPKDEAKLDGFDTSLSVIYNLYSDLQIGGNIGAYVCKEEKKMSNYYATVKASLKF